MAPAKAKARNQATPAQKATPAKKAAKGPKAAKVEKVAKGDQGAKPDAGLREGSKIALVVGMLQQPQGATLPAIMAATGWQPHTVRGFISTLGKKTGLVVNSAKGADGARTYSIAK